MCAEYTSLVAAMKALTQEVGKTQITLPVAENAWNSRPDADSNPQESAVRRQIIRETYEHAKANRDSHVVFVDGGQFYGSTDRDMCAVDGCHPTDLGFLRIADYLEPILRKLL